MSLLWTTATRHEAMPWNHNKGDSRFTHPVVHPVKNAGFTGHTGDSEYEESFRDSMDEGHQEEHEFDDDLYDSVRPEPTHEEQAHNEEHGEYPEDYEDRHDNAYHKALEDRRRKSLAEDTPDHEDPDLMKFVRYHGSNADMWRQHATFGPVNISKGVQATQPHVSQTHIDRYLDNPHDQSDHSYQFGQNSDYLGEHSPLFVTHQGILHATEGHHRTAAALQRGDSHIHGWHYDLDKDPAGVRGLDDSLDD